MIYEIRHTTTYAYDRPVHLEPHLFRLEPRSDPTQRVESFRLSARPEPTHLSRAVDPEGNPLSYAWFEGETAELEVVSHSRVRTTRTNPFDFLLHPPEATSLPMRYPSEIAEGVGPYISSDEHPDVRAFSADITKAAGHETIPFLRELSTRIFRECKALLRPQGDPLLPQETLARRAGACRDLAVLYLHAARSEGLAARFVSGYDDDEKVVQRELHAWVEVYLPGGGWRGFDPSVGLAVADEHVALAAGRSFREAAPVAGTFRSTGLAESKLATRIEMKRIAEPAS